MKVVGVIPARFGSHRLPGKPLLPILGKPLLQYVVEGSRLSQELDDLIVATDHIEIARLAEKLNVKVCMTDSDLPSGSDRVWAAVANEPDIDIVINIQGDEPLINGDLLDHLIRPFRQNPELQMATLARELKAEDLSLASVVKVVLNARQEAVYFSRFAIPYSRIAAEQMPGACLRHIGLYGYSKAFLQKFCSQKPVAMEQAEGLEQLRALYLGGRIHVVPVEHESWGVDTPEDVKKIEAILQARAGHGEN